MSTYLHPDAFRLLRYQCETCGFVEVVWNSRDGAVPDVIECAVAVLHGGVRDLTTGQSCGMTIPLFFDGEMATVWVVKARYPEQWNARWEACGGSAVYSPHVLIDANHDPLPGERYFRDGIPAEARAIVKAQIDRMRVAGDTSLTQDNPDVREYLRLVGTYEGAWIEEFAPGWPMLVVRGSDADGLQGRETT